MSQEDPLEACEQQPSLQLSGAETIRRPAPAWKLSTQISGLQARSDPFVVVYRQQTWKETESVIKKEFREHLVSYGSGERLTSRLLV